jgi:hypothetical protein
MAFAMVRAEETPTRPKFDKKPYLKTAWSPANPWWLPNKSRTHGKGGPDFAWHKFSDDPVTMWKEVAERYANYGITGLQTEMTVSNKNIGYTANYKNMLKGFEQAGNGMQVGCFISICGVSDVEIAKTRFIELFDAIMPEAKKHPNACRINGIPVVVLYGLSLKPKELVQVIKAVEDKHGRVIWLVNAASGKPEWLRSILPHVDGISMYGCWDLQTQRELYAWLSDVMHNEFPEKIFEGGIHTTYTVHFHYGGQRPKLTEKFRESWNITLAAKPDSTTVTNWFDCYENSRIMPSYELDDCMLKITHYMLDKWREKPWEGSQKPELYVSNYTNVRLGDTICIEILGFPLKDKDKDIILTVELCDGTGKTLHSFPEHKMTLDTMRAVLFEFPSEKIAEYCALLPKVSYKWKNKIFSFPLLPQSNLVTSLSPHLLFWSRSLDHIIKISGSPNWTLNGTGIGQVAIYPKDGRGLITSCAWSTSYSPKQVDGGGGWVRVLRNGREIDGFDNFDLKFTALTRIPDPGQTLDWYNIELENPNGGRYLSPPIWVSSGKRPGKITLPILCEDNTIKEVYVDAERVPFFYYPCQEDADGMLLDISGYDHHGYLGGKGYGGGHLARTAYRHEHLGLLPPSSPENMPVYKNDPDNCRFLELNGKDYVMLQGGTAFPYASTYELSMRPDKIGENQIILEAPNGQISISLLADGRISVKRKQALEGEGGRKAGKLQDVSIISETPLKEREWTHLAVVYNLREMTLYLNGKKEASALAGFNRNHEWINAVVLGGGCKFPFNPVPEFKGAVRNLRIYGRNLKPEEFIQDK